jgi:mono/diheme cytochrome c family protein
VADSVAGSQREEPVTRRLASFGLLLAVTGCGSTPDTGIAACPPAPDPEVLAALSFEAAPAGDLEGGAALFERECARCHSRAISARGSRLFRGYPRLDCPDYLARVSDPYLFTAISDGGPAVGRKDLMKPFSETLTEQEIADLVAFLRAGT